MQSLRVKNLIRYLLNLAYIKSEVHVAQSQKKIKPKQGGNNEYNLKESFIVIFVFLHLVVSGTVYQATSLSVVS